MNRITFSALPRLFACPASHVLPHTRDEEPSEYRDRGTAVHRFLEEVDADVFSYDAALKRVPEEHRAHCEAIDISTLPVDLTPEMSLAYDPIDRIARRLPRKHRRDYSAAKPREIVGTADVVGVGPRGVYVGDYKTGWAKQIPARENPQVLMAALCATRAFDRSSATLDVISVREDSSWHDTAEVDAFKLLAFEERLLYLVDLVVPGTSLTPQPGTHCRYCPAFEHCPEQLRLAVAATDGTLEAEVEREWAGVLTASSAPEAYSKYLAMVRLTKRAGDILRAYARKHPIDLGSGRRFGLVEKPGNERLNGDAVFTQCVRLYGHEVANHAVVRTATKKSISAALRTHKPILDASGTTQAAAKKAILDAVRAQDGVTRKSTSRVEEYDGKGD